MTLFFLKYVSALRSCQYHRIRSVGQTRNSPVELEVLAVVHETTARLDDFLEAYANVVRRANGA